MKDYTNWVIGWLFSNRLIIEMDYFCLMFFHFISEKIVKLLNSPRSSMVFRISWNLTQSMLKGYIWVKSAGSDKCKSCRGCVFAYDYKFLMNCITMMVRGNLTGYLKISSWMAGVSPCYCGNGRLFLTPYWLFSVKRGRRYQWKWWPELLMNWKIIWRQFKAA